MTKKDLKPCMIVERRDGYHHMVVPVCGKLQLVRTGGYDLLSNYTDNLTNRFKVLDIVKVKEANSAFDLVEKNWHECKTIWDRDQTKSPEYTMEELVEKLGHNFKIKK